MMHPQVVRTFPAMALVLVVVTLVCLAGPAFGEGGVGVNHRAVGSQPPAFDVPDVFGEDLSYTGASHQPTLIVFFSTRCPASHALLETLKAELIARESLQMYAFSLDGQTGDPMQGGATRHDMTRRFALRYLDGLAESVQARVHFMEGFARIREQYGQLLHPRMSRLQDVPTLVCVDTQGLITAAWMERPAAEDLANAVAAVAPLTQAETEADTEDPDEDDEPAVEEPTPATEPEAPAAPVEE